MSKVRKVYTMSAVAVLIAATAVYVNSMLPQLSLSSQQAFAQGNITQEATSSANQTGEQMQSGMANTTQEAKSAGNQTGEQAQSLMNQTGEALQNINPLK
jgi:phage gp45-like